jgi:hypothetical protein
MGEPKVSSERPQLVCAIAALEAQRAINGCAHAIMDRLFYPDAYPEGTAIRFESFQMWGI